MKETLILFIAILSISIVSCGDDDEGPTGPNVIGTYTIVSARDECPDPANNAMVDNLGMGICISQNCTTITLIISPNNMYSYEQIDDFDNGSIQNFQTRSETGTYTLSGDVLTTSSSDGSVTNYDVVDNGQFLDLLAAMTTSGCDRIIRLIR